MPAIAAATLPCRIDRVRPAAFALALALSVAPGAAWADDKGAPAKTGGNSIEDGFRSLGQQISDPKTLDRIKGHEQDFEKNVKSTRDQQRKSHPGEVRASDATGMANDPKMGGQGAGKAVKPKAGTPKGKKDAAPPATSSGAGAPPKAPPPAAAPANTGR